MSFDEREWNWRKVAEFVPANDGFDAHRALGTTVIAEVMPSEHDEPTLESVHWRLAGVVANAAAPVTPFEGLSCHGYWSGQ